MELTQLQQSCIFSRADKVVYVNPKECERLGTYVRNTDKLILEQCKELDEFR